MIKNLIGFFITVYIMDLSVQAVSACRQCLKGEFSFVMIMIEPVFVIINKLQEQLVDETLKTDVETAQNLVGELEEYLEIYSDSTSFVDYYILLGDLYSQTLKLPKKAFISSKK